VTNSDRLEKVRRISEYESAAEHLETTARELLLLQNREVTAREYLEVVARARKARQERDRAKLAIPTVKQKIRGL
jgi:hypothetical protein